jgi:hypothetical protein
MKSSFIVLTVFVLAMAGFSQVRQSNQPTSSPNGTLLEDGTPVRLRIARTVSSADAHVGETVDFEVLEEVRLGTLLMIPKGGVAWATVTEAQSKRRMARGGKLDMNIDSVRLVDGEKVALRAVKEVKGGGHTGAMTGAMVGTAIVFFPAAPLFLFMHGKDISIPKGTEITAYVNGNFPVDVSKFGGNSPSPQSAGAAGSVATSGSTATLDISSTPVNADIEVDGSFVGNTPSSFGLGSGEHTVRISKSGYRPWERKVRTSTGAARLVAELEVMPAGYVPPLPTAPRPVETDRTVPLNATAPAAPGPAKTAEYSKIESAAIVGASDKTIVQEGNPGLAQSTTKERSGEPSICARLGLKTENTDIAGAKISEIANGGVADHGGLHVGDIINSVDGKAVGGPGEFEAELQNRAPGTNIRVGYMFRSSALGYFSKEVVLPLRA